MFSTWQRNTAAFCAEISQNSVHAKIKVKCPGVYVVRMMLHFKYIYNEINCIQRDYSEYFDSENVKENLDASAIGLMGGKGSNQF